MFVLEEEQKSAAVLHKVNLIDGKFTPAEAIEIINELIDKKINFHKIQRLGITEGNHNDECPYDNTRINELVEEKKHLKTVLIDAIKNGKELIIDGQITLKVAE